jgi:tetratricopeptide (TPR) repeat protein
MRKTYKRRQSSIWGLGLSYSARVELDRAIQAFNESLKLKEKLVGVDDSSLAELLMRIAHLHSLQRRPIDGIPLIERALAISEKKFGPESAEAATALASLGNTRGEAGQFELALASLKRSLLIREKLSPPTSPDLGTTTSNLGTIYLGVGDYGQAMPLLERSVLLLEKSYVPHDATSASRFADALNKLGATQNATGRYERGMATLQRSADVTERAFGSASINLVAGRIIAARPFHSADDLKKVNGIADKKVRQDPAVFSVTQRAARGINERQPGTKIARPWGFEPESF